MSRRVLILALTLSLLFNVFVVVGFVKASRERHAMNAAPMHDTRRQAPPPPPNAFHRLASELNLSAQQSALLAELQDEHRQQNVVFDQTLALVRQNLREELRRDTPDLNRVRELVSEEAEMFRQRRLSEANLYGQFMDELTPEQRARMRDQLERTMRDRGHKQGPGPIPQKMIDRFDRNKNGILDPDELREARREMDRRRREWGNRRPKSPEHESPPPVE